MTMTVEMRPIDSIKVEDRVRGSFGDLRELVDSMRQRGLINPITVEPDGMLIAGERRLRAARELGWPEIAAHIWRSEPLDQVLAIEIEENTCRLDLTDGEKEIAWERYSRLEEERLRTLAKEDRPEDSSGGTSPKMAAEERIAKALNTSRPTMHGVKEIREAAEDTTQAPSVREVAKHEYRKIQAGTGAVRPGLDRVRHEKRKATQAAMAPGQRLRSDEPKAPPKPVDWRARLWDVVGNGKTIRKTAEELEVQQDTSEIPTEDIDAMRDLLQGQIRDREYLRKVLLNIKRGR